MKLYQLKRKIVLPVPIDVAWEFMSDPKNLARITPPDMGFLTLSGDDRKMYPGQIIEYFVRPFPSFKVKWVTEITHVDEGSYFVDEQRFGPYKFWHHKHFLRSVEGGTEMEDLIHYRLPFGILGRLIHPYLVRPKLEKIFQFRQLFLQKHFL